MTFCLVPLQGLVYILACITVAKLRDIILLLHSVCLCFLSRQVLNQTSRLEIQLLENSLSTNKLEKELMVQTNEISKLHDKNR